LRRVNAVTVTGHGHGQAVNDEKTCKARKCIRETRPSTFKLHYCIGREFEKDTVTLAGSEDRKTK
jgi:hypothetical protein